MKALQIITRLDPGGSSNICLTVARELKKKGFDIVIASGESTVAHDGVIWLKYLKREICPVYDVFAIIEIYRLIRKVEPDILHLHSSKAGLAGRIAGRMAGVKKIYYQPHGIVFYGYFSRIKSLLILLTERIMAKHADRIIALAQKAKEEFLEYKVGKPEQYRVIENGIDIEQFKPSSSEEKAEIRKEFGISQEDIVFGMSGRLVKLKGHNFFIDAFEKLSEEHSNVKGLIVGGGDCLESLKKDVANRNLDDGVIFTGYRSDIPRVLQCMDVLVQPSIVEGFGMAIIEANACAIPTIGFKVGGIIDIIRDGQTGMLTEYMDPGALHKAMSELTRDPEKRKSMGAAARKHVEENFTIEIMMKKILKCYNE
ncbi:glycosyltransferase family 4 protein [Elusimicrobiota bacterium]